MMNFSTYQENNSADSERYSFGYPATQQADPAVNAALSMQGSTHPMQQQAPAQAPLVGYPSNQHQMQGSMYPMQNLYHQFQDPQAQQPPVLQPGFPQQPPDGLGPYQMQQISQAQAMYNFQPQPQFFSGVTPFGIPMINSPQQAMSMPMVGSPQQFAMPQQFAVPQQFPFAPQQMAGYPMQPMIPQNQVPEGTQPEHIGPFGVVVPVPTETVATILPNEAGGAPAETRATLESLQIKSNASSESGASPGLGPKKAPTPPPKEQLPARKRSPPGFGKMTLKDKRDPIKPQVPFNYAKAAKSNKRDPAKKLEPVFKAKKVEPVLKNPRNSRDSCRSERQRLVRQQSLRKQVTTKPAHRRTQPAQQRKKKYGFRSKQNMIDKVFNALCKKYGDMGILAGMDEVLRGETTIRLHVKKFKALQRIEEALVAVEKIPWIDIDRISIPVSMKNQFQKKGFLVYCRVAQRSMVDEAKRIFQSFDEFKKCEIAPQTKRNPEEETIPASTENASRFQNAPEFDEIIDFQDIEKAEAANKAWHDAATAAKKAGHVEKDAEHSADSDWDDAFCGSVEACGLDQIEDIVADSPAEANPTPEENHAEEMDFSFADKMMLAEGDCGLVDLDLGPIDMCPQLSHGEAGL